MSNNPNEAVDNKQRGNPPDTLQSQWKELYEEPSDLEALPPQPAPQNHASSDNLVARAEPTSAASLLHSRLLETTSELTIRVNEVEISLDVVDVHRTADSICCLVKYSGMRCRIPNSENVVILLGGEELKAVFVGAWHSFDWLNVHVVVFPVVPPSPARA